MVKELWSVFPRLIEQRINSLLDEAEPNAMKAFHLYKTCQSESLWSDSFESFSEVLRSFFSRPRRDRSKSDLDRLLNRPVPSLVYEGFHLTFHSARVDNRSLLNIAGWAHHLMRVTYKSTCAVISEDVLTRTLQSLTSPSAHEKGENIEFEDFCRAWKKVVFRLFGRKYDDEFEKILQELHWLNTQLKRSDEEAARVPVIPGIYLTQTEIDWTADVHKAVSLNEAAPDFPLSRGPQKMRLIELERAINLYKIVQTSRFPEFVKHRENIRATILDRCERLLRECAR